MSSAPSSPRKTAQVERLLSQHTPSRPPTSKSLLSVLSSNTCSPTKETNNMTVKSTVLLDGLQFEDDFYLNLLAWHRHAGIVTGQGDRVIIYPTTMDRMDEKQITVTEDEIVFEMSQQVTAVGSVEEWVAVGDKVGRVTLLDADQLRAVRTITPHCSRVGVMDYNYNCRLLATGSRDSKLSLFDCRQQTPINTLHHHRQEVCGLKWSPCGTFIATGGNDNLLCVRDVRMLDDGKQHVARVENAHAAAIKAVAWAGSTLVTGGGTSDRRITAWQVGGAGGLQVQKAWSVLTPSQVCCLFTSPSVSPNVLVSTHGFTDNLVMSWDHRTLSRQHHHHQGPMEPKWSGAGHRARVLYGAVSPCGTVVATASGDGVVRLWECFKEAPKAVHRRALESKYL